MRLIANIDVPNLASGIAFYTQALGLTHSRTIDNDVAELEGASSTLYLLEKKAGSAVSQNTTVVRAYVRHWTPVHLDFVVENLDVAMQKVLNAGATCESECVEWMGSKCITFSDPFGHGFCLVAFCADTYASTP